MLCDTINDTVKVSELFGSRVFNEATMQQYVSEPVMEDYRNCLENNLPLSMETASAIAEGMKNWAVENGATHFTHWFQPLNGETAQKHDSFIKPTGDGRVILDFSAKELVKGEPDASSFPTGGLRATFEARGYSAWDPTASAFIKDGSLCIPTVFCSYSGEALDKKTPLLRSIKTVSTEAVRILRLFGDTLTKKVVPQTGAEQEYFLVDKDVYNKREDLKICGRTLFGAKPPKAQELDDHYFGTIKPRVAAFMADLDKELWKVGVLAKTKHNETAPSQHEMAPIYTDCNSANDQNQLTMEIMRNVAEKHGLVCLLHEKPFYWVNGSGKHNNWSLCTDTGKNLFSPGKTPSQNAQFLLFLASFVAAVDEYQELLRCSVAFAGNDHRLGALEAPPAIISIHIGDELEAIVDSLVNEHEYTEQGKKRIRIGLDVMPTIPKDTTDRNRTSPIAFTGNKFEFRMLGSSQSIAGPNTVLNTIVAEYLGRFADILEQADDFNGTLHTLIKETFKGHSRILFNGNGYDKAWITEAEKRGLANLADTASALPKYLLQKNIDLMERHGIYTKTEMLARDEIHRSKYCKVIRIEASTLADMVRHEILNAVSACEGAISKTILDKKAVCAQIDNSYELKLLSTLSTQNAKLMTLTDELEKSLNDGRVSDPLFCRDTVFALMEEIRNCINTIEPLVPKSYWPYPTYSELLSSV